MYWGSGDRVKTVYTRKRTRETEYFIKRNENRETERKNIYLFSNKTVELKEIREQKAMTGRKEKRKSGKGELAGDERDLIVIEIQLRRNDGDGGNAGVSGQQNKGSAACVAADDVAELSSYRCYRFTFFVSAPFVSVSLSLSQLCPTTRGRQGVGRGGASQGELLALFR